MLYCVTQPLEKYIVSCGSIKVGPIAKYEPEIFAMVSFFTPILFQWEEGSPVPLLERNVDVTEEVADQLRQALDVSIIGTTTIRELLNSCTDPVNFYDLLVENLTEDVKLPIDDTYTREQLWWVLDARMATWTKSCKHPRHIFWSSNDQVENLNFVKDHAYGKS